MDIKNKPQQSSDGDKHVELWSKIDNMAKI